jgi:hypothetical protein
MSQEVVLNRWDESMDLFNELRKAKGKTADEVQKVLGLVPEQGTLSGEVELAPSAMNFYDGDRKLIKFPVTLVTMMRTISAPGVLEIEE